MITRIISGAVLAAGLVSILLFVPQNGILFAVAVVSSVALYEFCSANFGKGKISVKLLSFVIGIGLLFLPEVCTRLLLTFGLIAALMLPVFLYKKISFKDVAKAFFGAIYIFGLLKYIYLTRIGSDGKFLVFAIFIGAFFTDIGAYFIGMLSGKHKLTEISPKKTVEGAVGGVLVTIAAFAVYAFIGLRCMHYGVNIFNLFVTGIVLAVCSELGDLAASVIKREVGIKDYGNLIPGHGGILDRIDSVLFTAPVFYYLNLVLPVFIIK